MTYTTTWKPDLTLVCIEEEVKALDTNQDLSRNGLYARAFLQGMKMPPGGWLKVQSWLGQVKTGENRVPSSMQVTLNEEMRAQLDKISSEIRKDLGLTRLKKTYMFKLILLNYRDSLRQKAMEAAMGKDGGPVGQMDGPEMVAALTRLLLLNRREDGPILEELRQILLKWRQSI